MARETDGRETTVLSPDEAFSVLGNETRIQILQTLGEADGPLSFTELRDRVGIRQGGEFNYHLDKLVGHFVQKTEDGYTLRQPGRRVIMAVLSGAVTDDPELEPTAVEFPCRHCGTPVEVEYSRGKVRASCPDCGGAFDESRFPPDRGSEESTAQGNLLNLPLPPAGVQDRSATDAFRTAGTVAHLESLAVASDICPQCSASVEQAIASVCEDHDAADGLCEQCHHRNAVRIHVQCTNCLYEQVESAVMLLLDVPELLVFVGEHGLNVTADGIEWGWYYEEEILSTEPFEARFTFTIDNDSISLTVNDDLEVVQVTR